MNIYLLTHTREQQRKTNTGVLIHPIMGQQCKTFIWQRKVPHPKLLQHIADTSVALLYPHQDSLNLSENSSFDAYILLDATWQEAQKMYNHSPYLHNLPKVSLQPDTTSIYTLRRNQKESGLCTAECAITLLKLHQQAKQATMIQQRLVNLIQSQR